MGPRGSKGHFSGQPRGHLIHRVPNELWGEVFKHYLAEPKNGTSESYAFIPESSLTTTLTTKYNPFPLGHICRDWRTMVVNMPTLWSSLAIAIVPKSSSMVPLVSLWLSRTKYCPLTLSLMQINSDTPDATVNEILSLFLRRVPQWRSINFVFSGQFDEGIYDKLCHFPVGTAKMLQSVRFEASYWSHTSIDAVWGQFHLVSSLRRIDWCLMTYLGFMNSYDVLCWSRLTHIKMRSAFGKQKLNLDKFLDILELCKELIELTCNFRGKFMLALPSEDSIRSRYVVIPKLRTLKLLTDNEEPGPLLCHIKLPSLDSLHIDNVFDSSRQDPQLRLAPHIINLLTRSGCCLEKFSICVIGLIEHELAEFLSSPVAQHLIDLELTAGCDISDQTIKLLTHAEGHPKYLSKLEVLQLPWCATSEGVLSRMFISRSPQLKIIHSPFVCSPGLSSRFLETPQGVEGLRYHGTPT